MSKYTVFSLSKGKDAYIGLTQDLSKRLNRMRYNSQTIHGREYFLSLNQRIRKLGGVDALSLNIIGEFDTRAEGYEMQMHQLNTVQPSLNTLFKDLNEYHS